VQEILIAQDGEKGRRFRGYHVASIEADWLWEGGQASTEVRRPVYLMIAASKHESRALVANLRTGRKAILPETGSSHRSKHDGAKLELLRSAGYRVFAQECPDEMVVTTFYLPWLFEVDPGMVDPERIGFVTALPARWLTDELTFPPGVLEDTVAYLTDTFGACSVDYKETLASRPALIDRLARIAPMFAAYLDRRTRAPLIPHPRFHAHLLCAALDPRRAPEGTYALATLANNANTYNDRYFGCGWPYTERELDSGALAPGVAFYADHAAFETFLAKETAAYLRSGKNPLSL
jgi:hypothetical protein